MSLITILKIVIIVLALCGFMVAKKIHKSKRSSKPFVCPLKFNCHAVTSSNYSKLFGIPLEYWGMLYYAVTAIAYAVLLIVPELMSQTFTNTMIVVSIIAFVFSFFLTYVQAVKIREWCSWCLVSAFLSTAITVCVLWLNFV